MARLTSPKNQKEICVEWDNLCAHRQKIINEGKDVSLISVTTPWLVKEVKEEQPKYVLDVGCGTGYVTYQIAKEAECVCCGIDLSHRSIQLAKETYNCDGLSFVPSSISDFVPDFPYTVYISNMVFTSDPDWIASAKKMYDILPSGGCLMVMIPHPCFWPQHWDFLEKEWLNYNEELFIESDFPITMVNSIGKSTYIHRPLSQYIQGLLSVGFVLEKLEEPFPLREVPQEYQYRYPHFLYLKCRKR